MAAKLMDMSKGKPSGLPFDIEGPGDEAPGSGGGQIPDYVGPWEHCAACEYFDGQSMCKKFNAPCDMDGGCPAFEVASEEGSADNEYAEMMGEEEDES
jgi:hypothetical protein